MKRTLALILAAVLLLVALPISVSAADINISSDVTNAVTIASGSRAYITRNITIRTQGSITVAAGAELYINPGVTVTVNGYINNFGTIYNKGTIANKGNVQTDPAGTGMLKHFVTIPASYDASAYTVLYCINLNHIWDDFFDNIDDYNANTEHYYASNSAGFSDYVQDGYTVYFTLLFNQPKIDPYKFEVNAGGARLIRDRGVYAITAGNAVNVTYGTYNASALIKQIKIALPSGDGYRVVCYGTSLEQAVQDAIDFVWVDYGSTLSFRVEVFEGWQDSNIVVTIGGLDPSAQAADASIAGPDTYGYYEIRNITDKKAATNAYEINVAGVVSDDTQNLIKSIMKFIQDIFQTIKEIFSAFFELFNFNIGTTAAPSIDAGESTPVAP